mmetsp:Transcript_19230/g.55176  ORF Transcript_19230/g.55176 Transcript_19230/m.55176 type:complete len:262 (+) Transcript_19230:1173-1958(+)
MGGFMSCSTTKTAMHADVFPAVSTGQPKLDGAIILRPRTAISEPVSWPSYCNASCFTERDVAAVDKPSVSITKPTSAAPAKALCQVNTNCHEVRACWENAPPLGLFSARGRIATSRSSLVADALAPACSIAGVNPPPLALATEGEEPPDLRETPLLVLVAERGRRFRHGETASASDVSPAVGCAARSEEICRGGPSGWSNTNEDSEVVAHASAAADGGIAMAAKHGTIKLRGGLSSSSRNCDLKAFSKIKSRLSGKNSSKT